MTKILLPLNFQKPLKEYITLCTLLISSNNDNVRYKCTDVS